jgi:hypothetical protein
MVYRTYRGALALREVVAFGTFVDPEADEKSSAAHLLTVRPHEGLIVHTDRGT